MNFYTHGPCDPVGFDLDCLDVGIRESGTVGIAIRSRCAHAGRLLLLWLYAESRTLFALIFSIGILVDDAIVVVENIVRHYHLPENKGRPVLDIAVEAVDEVGNPTLLRHGCRHRRDPAHGVCPGADGPYMRPIPVAHPRP